MKAIATVPGFAALVQAFFCQRLIEQQNVSARTVASYRDTFRLLLGFLERHRKKPPGTVALGPDRRPSPRSSITSRRSGITASAPATPGSPPSAPS